MSEPINQDYPPQYGQDQARYTQNASGAQDPQYPVQYGPPPFSRSRKTNGLAIASMVLGIVWIYWIGSILALVFGYVARRQIRENNQYGGGMAIAGIVLGWVGVGFLLLGVVVSGILPIFNY